MAYFNGQLLPNPTYEYVAWLDVMGVQASMSRSLPMASNFVFKLHIAALQAKNADVRLYPVMDGLYVSALQQTAILDFLRGVLADLANDFNREAELFHRFVVRGALAFGPVIHGEAIPERASNEFGAANGQTYKNSILVGMPIVQAHQSEKLAPPFGIFVHESARAPMNFPSMPFVWWKWVNAATGPTWDALLPALNAYYEWCTGRPDAITYEKERIAAHRNLAHQYFG